jgi:hypothetical protein
MKTKRQLQEQGFLFITTSGGAISCSKLSKEMQTVFTTKAKSLQTVIKRANKHLELC